MSDGIWGLQANVANSLPGLNSGGLLGIMDSIAQEIMEDGDHPHLLPVMLVIAAMRYANHLGVSVDDYAPAVLEEMKTWPQ